MTQRKTIYAADLFCGAGGTSTGLAIAAAALGITLKLAAVNHWQRAIETHSASHPWAKHFCADLAGLDPEKAARALGCRRRGGIYRLDLLVASPECTHHSVARGGRPCNDQSRAGAWHILAWCQKLYVKSVLIENVPEWVNWGPLGADGQPLKSKRGEAFLSFVEALRSLGYRVEWKILNCADYGDATTRRRLFMQATRGRGKITWPAVTHTEPERRPASEIIDWGLRGKSIFARKRPLAENTLRRIEAGIKKYWGEWAEPFLVLLRGTAERHIAGSPHKTDQPLPTTTAGGGHVGLVQPFVVQAAHGTPDGNYARRVKGVDEPLQTVTKKNGLAICEPFLVKFNRTGGANDPAKPLDTVSTRARFGVVEGEAGRLDILFRMLQPHELAAAHSFPADYSFAGNKSEIVKQIGNSVPVATAAALCGAILAGSPGPGVRADIVAK